MNVVLYSYFLLRSLSLKFALLIFEVNLLNFKLSRDFCSERQAFVFVTKKAVTHIIESNESSDGDGDDEILFA
jgi:hypothetical protein